MSEERDKVRCKMCELVQWSDHEKCRRCGSSLPEPVVNIVEHVVERIVFRPCFPRVGDGKVGCSSSPAKEQGELGAISDFPTMAEMERTMVLAAYHRSNRRPLEAARLLGIGKTTVYRKLREMQQAV